MNETGEVVLPVNLEGEQKTLTSVQRELRGILEKSYGLHGSMGEPFWHAATDMAAGINLKRNADDDKYNKRLSQAYLDHRVQVESKRKEPTYENAYHNLETMVWLVADLHHNLDTTIHGLEKTDETQENSHKYADDYLINTLLAIDEQHSVKV